MAAALLVAIAAGGCASAGREPAAVPPSGEAEEIAKGPLDQAPAAAEATEEGGELAPGESERIDLTRPPAGEQEPAEEKPVEGPCAEPQLDGEKGVDGARRRLFETFCGAALWFDGLFGEQRHIAAARRISGRLELSLTESEYWGTKARTRLHVRVRLPNLEERFEAFVGRGDEDEFVEDRNEGFALRSQFAAIEQEDRWVAGLGYGLPGSYEKRTDFRLGAKGGQRPEVFAQGRHRRNWFVGDDSLWHFRQTFFWATRDGFGSTTALDFDHVLKPTLLFRWGNIVTFSEATDGLKWRVAGIFYQNLKTRGRAIAYEMFVRGETDEVIPLREYGVRTVLRRPILGREWLFGELYLGYAWPRELRDEKRDGSYAIGFGVELLFGRSDTY
jgi:hypothetical protein